MIVFTSIKNIPDRILEELRIRQVIKYNLSSYYEDIPYLINLLPNTEYIPVEVASGEVDSPDFDIDYHNYIFDINKSQAFISFMQIIIPVYMHPDILVQILIEESSYRDVITESLVKLIQQRYGYNSYIIHHVEDFETMREQEFSIPGLFMMDQDLMLYNSITNAFSGDME